MDQTQTHGEICAALRNRAAVDFAREVAKVGYRQFFPERLEEVQRMVDGAYERLALSQRGAIDPSALLQVASQLLDQTFRKSDPTFWFNRGYHHYKTKLKPETDVSFLGSLIVGTRVLDYGCGSGVLSVRLAREGYDVFTTDILDYRYDEAKGLPFVQMTSATELAYPDASIDTALVQAVLHHIDEADLPIVVRSLARVARQVVIKEDVYGLDRNAADLTPALHVQPLFQAFAALTAATQYQALILMDFYSNAIAQGIAEMNMPFGFRTVPQWRSVLEANGFAIRKTLITGFEKARMHTSCYAWLVCESMGRRAP